MGLRCIDYRALDWFKQTWLAAKVIFHGEKFQHFEEIVLEGVVLSPEHHATDGDCTFDIEVGENPHVPAGRLHCEITPCQDDAIHKLAESLKPGMRTRVSGPRTYDPTHLDHPAHWEIHPVTKIEILG